MRLVSLRGKERMRNIKSLALQAKNRLRGLCKEEVKNNLRVIKGENYNQIKVIIAEDDSEKLYEKFKNIISQEDIHNPIGVMMDKKLYSQLCESKKEKYFFDTLEKYQKLRERCSKEQQENIQFYVG